MVPADESVDSSFGIEPVAYVHVVESQATAAYGQRAGHIVRDFREVHPEFSVGESQVVSVNLKFLQRAVE